MSPPRSRSAAPTRALLGKEAREHGFAAIGLVLASLVLTGVALAQNDAAAFGMSPFEVVRFALVSFLPLVALIVGNRLVVREYLAGTRLFVEALPVGPLRPLVLKYLLGLGYLTLLGIGLVLLCAAGTSLVDDVTPAYLGLLAAKVLTMLALYWSIVFCFSLCGHLRVALYLATIGIVLLVAWSPGIDGARFAPFELMDAELFVFEREVLPLAAILWTLALAAGFTAVAFVVARLGDGSVADRLARPMSRRDLVVLGVLGAAGLALAGLIVDQRERDPVAFTGEAVLRVASPPIELFYLDDEYRPAAQRFLDEVRLAIESMEARLGTGDTPALKLALRPTRDPHDIDYGALDGVYVAANWLGHDAIDDRILIAVVLHGLLTAQSGGRATFEPYHWMLDGFTRWWAETLGDPGALGEGSRVELLARAAFVLERLDPDEGLIGSWQRIADDYGYPGAEALAFAAMRRLAAVAGPDAVTALAREFLIEPVGASAFASLEDRRRGVRERFRDATGLDWGAFRADLRTWLRARADTPAVRAQLDRIPPLVPVIGSRIGSDGVQRIVGGYRLDAQAAPTDAPFPGRCIMRHALIGPFDREFDVDDEDEVAGDCTLGEAVHVLGGRYASGDRVYVALEYESDDFHQPVRLGASRLEIR